MRPLVTALIGFAIAVLVVGLALAVLTQPLLTRALSQRFSLAQEAGLPRARMLDVAEQVRSFVAGPSGPTLPEVVDGREGFDAAAVSHLADVRSVIAGARVVTWVLAVLLAIWLGVQVSGRRIDRVAGAMRAAAWWCLGLVVLGAAGGMLDFDALFTAFHGLFFAQGTWMFAEDSLLIQTFPEPFWATAAALWAGLVLLGAAALGVGVWLLSSARARPFPIHEDGASGDGA